MLVPLFLSLERCHLEYLTLQKWPQEEVKEGNERDLLHELHHHVLDHMAQLSIQDQVLSLS